MPYPVEIHKVDTRFVRFMGASYTTDGDETKIYHPIGEVYVNPSLVSGFYDHTILISGCKIRVMEDLNEITEKL